MEQKQSNELENTSHIPILITSSITPHDIGVKLLDPERRLFHALEAIEHWIRVAPASRFVLCDGSNFDFSPIAKERFPDTQIECLFFENEPLQIANFGRGFGEGEIVKFALRNSLYLRQSGAFAKCSSKLWLENYADCAKEWTGDCLFSAVFNNAFSISRSIEMAQIDTRFYITSNDFYSRHLVNAHLQINTSTGFGLEDCFHARLCEIQQRRYLFPVTPHIRGVGGGTGTYYKYNRIRVFKDSIRLAIAKKSRKLNNLFSCS